MAPSITPLLVRAKSIIACNRDVAQGGVTFADMGRLDDAAMIVEGERVAAIGRRSEIEAALLGRNVRELDLRDCIVVPGFIDAHAHPLFAGDREPDFAARQRGERAPLGMLYTVERTRDALLDPGAFYRNTVRPRLRTMLAHGTTTLETKTGYALHKPGEMACPATIDYLDLQHHAPVRALLEAGGTVALASDYNPGTSPCFNLQTVAYFGRKLFGLSAAEALYGVTRAAAASLHVDAGSLRPGGPADFVALEIDSPDEFGWQHGGNLARTVVRAGVPV